MRDCGSYRSIAGSCGGTRDASGHAPCPIPLRAALNLQRRVEAQAGAEFYFNRQCLGDRSSAASQHSRAASIVGYTGGYGAQSRGRRGTMRAARLAPCEGVPKFYQAGQRAVCRTQVMRRKRTECSVLTTGWPSGLRRYVQVVVS